MSLTFRTFLGLFVAAVACSACELVLGDIPDKAVVSGGGTGGDVATTAAGGTSSTTTSDASNAGTGGDNGSGGSFGAGGETSGTGGTSSAGGLGGSVGTAGSSAGGGAGMVGAGGSGGAAGASGKGGSSGAGTSGNGGSGPGDASPEGAPRDAGSDADPCDVDGDGYRSRACGGNDCDDNAILVHPGQLNYSVDPTHVGGTDFDFDCNGLPQPQFGSINCAGLGLTCDTSASAFFGMMAPECGNTGRFGKCKTSGLSCIEQLEQAVKQMPCR